MQQISLIGAERSGAAAAMLFGLLVFGTIVAGVIWFVTAYNTLIAAAQRASFAWGNVDALLRQRHDEIPRLLEAYQRHIKHGQRTFDRALEARNTIFGARQTENVVAIGRAERELRATLRELRELAAAHPALLAEPAFVALEARIATLDAGIAERRAIYNDAAQQNNIAIGGFPGRIVASLGGFRLLQPFEFDTSPRTE
jgi:LemA protein